MPNTEQIMAGAAIVEKAFGAENVTGIAVKAADEIGLGEAGSAASKFFSSRTLTSFADAMHIPSPLFVTGEDLNDAARLEATMRTYYPGLGTDELAGKFKEVADGLRVGGHSLGMQEAFLYRRLSLASDAWGKESVPALNAIRDLSGFSKEALERQPALAVAAAGREASFGLEMRRLGNLDLCAQNPVCTTVEDSIGRKWADVRSLSWKMPDYASTLEANPSPAGYFKLHAQGAGA